MSDVDWIFVVLVGLYLIESMVWLKQGVTVFTRFFGKLRSPTAAIRLIGNDFGALALGGSLPWDVSFLCEPLPISVSPEGVVPFVPASPLQPDRRPATGLLFAWDDLRKVRRDEHSLLVKSQFICKARNHRSASHLCEMLKHIAGLEPDQREPVISHLIADQLDQTRVSEQYQEWNDRTGRLRLAASLLFFWTLPVGIICYYDLIPIPVPRDTQFTIVYFAIFVTLWLWAILESVIAHVKLLPHDKSGRFKMLFTSMVSPVVPMRAPDRLAREFFLFVHPLTFATVLGDAQILTTCAEETVRDLRFPRLPELPGGISDSARAVVRWSSESTKAQIESLLTEIGNDIQSLAAQPNSQAIDAKSYCPRCHDDFSQLMASCSRCGNRPTVPFGRA